MVRWILAAVVLVFVLLALARRSFRTHARRRLVAALRSAGVEVLDERPGQLLLRGPGGDGPLFLDRYYQAVANLGSGATDEQRDEVVAHWVATILEVRASEAPLTQAEDGARVLPRLVTPAFFDELPPDAGVPHTPLGQTGLVVVYVLDLERSVSFLTARHLGELGLDRAGAHALALGNLAGRTPPEVLRGLTERTEGVTVLKTGDTYDAARLLLLPRHVPEGEARLVVVPDRDSLVVLADDGAEALRAAHELARLRGGERPLFDRPLRVTREGVTLASKG